MKIRNKKIMTTLIAIFAVVFMAGSAFAFSGQGLTFIGTANVDASLELLITGARATDGQWTVDARIVGDYENVREVNFAMDFTAPDQRAAFAFDITNVGTMPAHIYAVNIAEEIFSEYHGDILEQLVATNRIRFSWHDDENWTEFAVPVDLGVEEVVTLFVIVDFLNLEENLDVHNLQGSVVNTLSLEYSLLAPQ